MCPIFWWKKSLSFRSFAILASFVLGYCILDEVITIQKILSMMLVISGLILVLQPWRDHDNISDQKEVNLSSETNRSLFPSFTELPLNLDHNLLNRTKIGNISTTANISVNLSTTPAVIVRCNKAPTVCFIFGYMLAISSGLCKACTTTIQKRFSPHIPADVLTFYICCGGCLLSTVLMLLFEEPKWPNNLQDSVWLLVHSSTIGLSQLLGNWSKLLMSQTLYYITTTNFIIFSLIGQYTLLSHINPGYRNPEEISGAVLVILGMALPILPLINISHNSRKDVIYSTQVAKEDTKLVKKENN